MSLENIRIVLVRPKFAGNVGAVARVMRNTGFDKLVLVSPEADLQDREARKLSTHGEAILDRVRIVDDLKSAIGECVYVVATTARTAGSLRASRVEPPEEALSSLAAVASAPAALVFGPETNGLTNDEVDLCHGLLSIPLEAEYPAMNLAQAAAVCLYLLRRVVNSTPASPTGELAADGYHVERMVAAMQKALERIEYLRGDRGDELCQALRRMISRCQPTAQEVNYLLGLAKQIEWFARRQDSTKA